jgi:conjugative transfer signal peptidase TraF
MMRRAFGLGVLYVALFFFAERVLFSTVLVVNTTPSVPTGVYVKMWWQPRVGDTVRGCLPRKIAEQGRAFDYLDAGDCPGDAAPVYKLVEALPGQRVDVGDDGVRIDGRLLPMSGRVADTAAARDAVPVGIYTVRPAALWLGSCNPMGWDSRYYRDVQLTDVSVVWRP